MDDIFNYSYKINGKAHTCQLKLIADLIKPCSFCGIPACGEEMYIWATFLDNNLAIGLDGRLFTSFMSDVFKNNVNISNYAILPEFLKEWNEGKGWDDWDNAEGSYQIDANDFNNALEIIKNSKLPSSSSDDYLLVYYPIMKNFVEKVIKENKQLNILK